MAVGAVLAQGEDGSRPLAFFSKKLTPPERKYSTFDRELLSAFLEVKHFRHIPDSPADLVFGSSLCLPADLLDPLPAPRTWPRSQTIEVLYI